MVNCAKCGKDVDHPVKTWKIKQTPVALFECPSCKTKWRSKYIEPPAIPQIAQLAKPELPREIQFQTVTEEQKGEPLLVEAIKTVVENNVEEHSKPSSILSGIRSFFSSLL